MKAISLFAALAIICVLAIGCESSKDKGYKPAAKAQTSLQDAAQRIDKANSQVDRTLASLNTVMQVPGDLPKAYKDYSSALADLDAMQRDIAGKAYTMREKREAYFSQWEMDVATVKNEDVRTRSEARKAELKTQFDKVRADYQTAQKILILCQ